MHSERTFALETLSCESPQACGIHFFPYYTNSRFIELSLNNLFEVKTLFIKLEQMKDVLMYEILFFFLERVGMQNLSISCSLVCLIILGSAALIGAFGVCQRQISAILVTGVMYLLAGL